jgi:hypothetical protein
LASARFGVSLLAGSRSHEQVLDALPASMQTIAVGAAIGIVAWFESLFGDKILELDDGCYPKMGLSQG